MIREEREVSAEEFFFRSDEKVGLILKMNEIIDRGRRRHEEHDGKKPRGSRAEDDGVLVLQGKADVLV
jgi:hypothetical protein